MKESAIIAKIRRRKIRRLITRKKVYRGGTARRSKKRRWKQIKRARRIWRRSFLKNLSITGRYEERKDKTFDGENEEINPNRARAFLRRKRSTPAAILDG